MNKHGISVVEKNPFEFEKQQMHATIAHSKRVSLEPIQIDLQGKARAKTVLAKTDSEPSPEQRGGPIRVQENNFIVDAQPAACVNQNITL